MNPQHAKVISDFLLTNLDYEVTLTLGVFEAVPAGRLDYRPDSLSRTALALMRHLTLEDEWLLNAIAAGSFAPLPDDTDACGILTPADAIAQYKQRIPAATARVRACSGEDLVRIIDLFGAIKMPAVGFLSLMLRHTAHHRGQLSSYLRAMGAKVPPIYGPTADTVAATA
jgi:uncharacterized damage-inducible protein DinB